MGEIASHEWKAWDKAGTRGPCGDGGWSVKERECGYSSMHLGYMGGGGTGGDAEFLINGL